MKRIKVWDPLVRVFHWCLVAGIVADGLLIEEDSKLHEQVGLTVLALIGIRLIWGVIGTRHARFSDFPPSVPAALGQVADMATGREGVHLGHTPLGALMIYNLLTTVAAIGVTGWMMTTRMFWGSDMFEELHEGLVVWLTISVAVHVAAVIFESRRTGVNLPRAMVSGYKDIPNDRTVQ